jgi:hypothetical protein
MTFYDHLVLFPVLVSFTKKNLATLMYTQILGQLCHYLFSAGRQDCQMVCFQTKNPNWGKFWRALEWKILVYFMIIWNILRPIGVHYGPMVILW